MKPAWLQYGAAIALSVLTHSNAPGATADPRLRVDEQAGIFWVDNERVLFRGFTPEALKKIEAGTFTIEEGYRTPRAIRTFNVRTGEIREHALSFGGGLCFSNGHVVYSRDDDLAKGPSYVSGPLDGEQKASDLTRDVERRGFTSRLRCYNPDTSGFPPWPAQIVPLRDEHGFVELRYRQTDRGIRGEEAELFLYRKGEKDPMAVTGYRVMHAANLANNAPSFAPWKGAYFNYTVGVRDSMPSSGWWLYPDGTTEKVDIPAGPWNAYSRTNASFEPARCGLAVNITYRSGDLLFLRGNLAAQRRSGDVFPRLSAPEKLSPGPVWRLAVSPDGEKVAIVVGATAIPNADPSRLRIIDLCKAP